MSSVWAHLTWQQLRDAAASDPVVIVPTACVETQGPWTPVGMEFVLADRLARDAAERTGSLALPALPFGNSDSFVNIPGTIFVRPEILTGLYHDVFRSVVRAGFERILCLSYHIPNQPYIERAARLLREETGVVVTWMNPGALAATFLKRALPRPGGGPRARRRARPLPDAVRARRPGPRGRRHRREVFDLPWARRAGAGVTFRGFPVGVPVGWEDSTRAPADLATRRWAAPRSGGHSTYGCSTTSARSWRPSEPKRLRIRPIRWRAARPVQCARSINPGRSMYFAHKVSCTHNYVCRRSSPCFASDGSTNQSHDVLAVGDGRRRRARRAQGPWQAAARGCARAPPAVAVPRPRAPLVPAPVQREGPPPRGGARHQVRPPHRDDQLRPDRRDRARRHLRHQLRWREIDQDATLLPRRERDVPLGDRARGRPPRPERHVVADVGHEGGRRGPVVRDGDAADERDPAVAEVGPRVRHHRGRHRDLGEDRLGRARPAAPGPRPPVRARQGDDRDDGEGADPERGRQRQHDGGAAPDQAPPRHAQQDDHNDGQDEEAAAVGVPDAPPESGLVVDRGGLVHRRLVRGAPLGDRLPPTVPPRPRRHKGGDRFRRRRRPRRGRYGHRRAAGFATMAGAEGHRRLGAQRRWRVLTDLPGAFDTDLVGARLPSVGDPRGRGDVRRRTDHPRTEVADERATGHSTTGASGVRRRRSPRSAIGPTRPGPGLLDEGCRGPWRSACSRGRAGRDGAGPRASARRRRRRGRGRPRGRRGSGAPGAPPRGRGPWPP